MFTSSDEKKSKFSHLVNYNNLAWNLLNKARKFIKKRFQHRSFPVNIAKFLRIAPFKERL